MYWCKCKRFEEREGPLQWSVLVSFTVTLERAVESWVKVSCLLIQRPIWNRSEGEIGVTQKDCVMSMFCETDLNTKICQAHHASLEITLPVWKCDWLLDHFYYFFCRKDVQSTLGSIGKYLQKNLKFSCCLVHYPSRSMTELSHFKEELHLNLSVAPSSDKDWNALKLKR